MPISHYSVGIPQSLAACDFCETILDIKKVYRGKNARICRQCASKAQIELLHPDDPEVIAECQKIEHDLALGNSA